MDTVAFLERNSTVMHNRMHIMLLLSSAFDILVLIIASLVCVTPLTHLCKFLAYFDGSSFKFLYKGVE